VSKLYTTWHEFSELMFTVYSSNRKISGSSHTEQYRQSCHDENDRILHVCCPFFSHYMFRPSGVISYAKTIRLFKPISINETKLRAL
jgi:hypothetical protein